MLGDGGCTHTSPIFTNADEIILSDLINALPDGVSLKHIITYDYRISGGRGNSSNPVTEILRKHRMVCLAKHKRIPEFVFSLSNKYVAIVLNALFACDAYVYHKGFGITLASEGMIDDIRHLLLRFGVVCRKRYRQIHLEEKNFDAWEIICSDLDGIISIADNIGILGKQDKLEKVIGEKSSARKNTKDLVADFDIDSLYEIISNSKLSGTSRGYSDQIGYNLLRACRQENVSRPFAKLLSDHFGEQQDRAYSDIFWDRIKSIEYIGREEVMDLTVEDGHNFIADDVFVHNTSYGVWWLWREIQEKGSGDYLVVAPTFPLLDKKLLPEFLKVVPAQLGMGRWWAANMV